MNTRLTKKPPSLAASPATIIAWSLSTHRPTQFFTSRLGLPQTERSKHVRGFAAFEGEAAASCRSLYFSTREVTKDLIERFACKEDLRTEAFRKYEELSKQYIEPMLPKFGPVLWSPSENERATKIDRRHYPRYLEYSAEKDYERIKLYLCCWVLSQTIRKLPQTPPDVDDPSSDDEPLMPSPTARRGMKVIGESANPTGENAMDISGPTNPVAEPAVPVAPMFGTRSTYLSRASNHQRGMNPGGYAEEIPDSASDSEYDENIRFFGNSAHPGTVRARVKRKSDSIRTHPDHHVKRYKDLHGASISGTLSSRLHGKPNLRDTAASHVVTENTVYASSSQGEGLRIQNFPNITLAAPTHGLLIDQNMTGEENARTAMARRASGQHAIPKGNAGALGADSSTVHEVEVASTGYERNSEETLANKPLTRSKSLKITPSLQPRQSLVVPMQFTTQSRDVETLRLRLASKIIDIMPSELQNPNLILLSSFIEVIETLLKASRLQLINIYGDDYHNQHVAVQMWIQCLKHVATFYDITGFKDNLDARDEFMKTLPRDTRMAVVKPFIHGRANLREFRHDRGTGDEAFADDVASMLFNLGSWGGLMDLTEIEGMTLEFTRELLAWFT